MNNPIKDIYKFNVVAGLADKPFNDKLESSFIIEEALENLELAVLATALGQDSTTSPKELARAIMSKVDVEDITDVQRLDKCCDIVVFAIGAMVKLGLNPAQITKALNIVMLANMAKVNCPKDEYGKLTKPADFDERYAPEPKLRALLEEVRA